MIPMILRLGTSQSPPSCALLKGLTLMDIPLDPTAIGPCARSDGSNMFFLLHYLLKFWTWIRRSKYFPCILSDGFCAPPPELLRFLLRLRRFRCFEGFNLHFSCESNSWISSTLVEVISLLIFVP
jgi:hypothetical protein